MSTQLSVSGREHLPAVRDFAPWIAALRAWMVAGVAAVIVFPSLRGVDPALGWLPFWLVVAPAIDLAVLRRRQLAAQAARWIVQLRRRRRSARRQAMPLYRRRIRTRRSPRVSTTTATPE